MYYIADATLKAKRDCFVDFGHMYINKYVR